MTFQHLLISVPYPAPNPTIREHSPEAVPGVGLKITFVLPPEIFSLADFLFPEATRTKIVLQLPVTLTLG
jgi:hypothetical protein